MDNFAVFILTHGRPNRVVTYKALLDSGYSGQIFLLVDNEDSTLEEYQRIYGDQVIIFDKEAIAQTFDEAGIFEDRRSVVYARNASFEAAKELGIRYFMQLDDDYRGFYWRFTPAFKYQEQRIKDLNRVFEIFLDYYKSIPALSIAMGQSGDYIGGKESTVIQNKNMKRKAMNTFFCDTERPFQFLGRINEDVNTYVTLGTRGGLFLSIFSVFIHQIATQQNMGGMTDLYLDSGTYIKSFYTVMFNPSCVTVGEMGTLYKRLHHVINWEKAVPKILSEKFSPKS